ncbi:unnamed protein product, partial [Ectocarpus sp. 8 AP-2014]
DDDKAATAYSLALARVRRETVQEGLRKGGHNVPAEEGDDSKVNKPTVVSIKHTMSRVKARGIAGAPAVSDRPAPGETRISDGSRLKAALRASIESQTSSHEGLGDLDFNDGDDDDDDEDDLDSPRHRGRQYDDRWKMPGKAESVLASFVERLEHRGLAVDGGESGGSGGEGGGEAGGGGGRDSTESYGETSASAALAEARADRHAAVAVLSRNTRLHSERSTRNSPGPSAALAADGSSGGRKRKSSKG